VERLAEQNCEAGRELWGLACRELESLQDHLLLLGRKSALERVSTFLTKLFRRARSPSILLPMSRGDIADHLGLTLETVSRALSQLVREGVISLPSPRRVELRRPEALAA
jgi:CRP/FNR family nitrogen fixation transcriptional regulator